MSTILGQHFLVNRNVAKKMAAELGPMAGPVLEIGPGRGALTEWLLADPAVTELAVVEYDAGLAADLQTRFGPRLRVMVDDIRRSDPELIFSQRPFHLAGNVPYYLSKELIDWVLLRCQRLISGLLMFQKDFVDKLLAEEGGKSYGAQSVLFQLHFHTRRCFVVQPGSFSPAPKVISAVIRFGPRTDRPPESGGAFHQFVRAAFARRRKTLANNLPSQFDRRRLELLLANLGLPAATRPEQVSPETFRRLYNGLTRS